MFAKIKRSTSIARSLQYNERKMEKGVAECLKAHHFIKDVHQLTYAEKLFRFKHRNALNEGPFKNSVHLSLNFAPSENLSREKLLQIADRYMQKTGFGNQPYLVYRHLDAGHPHLHIVSTPVQKDGSRVRYVPWGSNSCEKARIEVEIEFGLLPGKTRDIHNYRSLKNGPPKQIIYGKMETTRSIANVLTAVLPIYRYSSLDQLNAILQLYNVLADRGAVGSFMYQRKGLLYHVLDGQGKKISTPIKASLIDSKATLTSIEKKFVQNEPLKQPYAARIKTLIDFQLASHSPRLPGLIRLLEQQAISIVFNRSSKDLIKQVHFVDHQTKCVFSDSELGTEYQIESFQQRCVPENNHAQHLWNRRQRRIDDREEPIIQIPGQPTPSGQEANAAGVTEILPAISGLLGENEQQPTQRKEKRNSQSLT